MSKSTVLGNASCLSTTMGMLSFATRLFSGTGSTSIEAIASTVADEPSPSNPSASGPCQTNNEPHSSTQDSHNDPSLSPVVAVFKMFGLAHTCSANVRP
jgi:hypothetical protein